MSFPITFATDEICDADRFLAFADRAAAQLDAAVATVAAPAGGRRALVSRASEPPATVDLGEDLRAVADLCDELGRLTDVACGVGVATAYSYPGSVRSLASSDADLERAGGVAVVSGAPSLLVYAFFCALDDRSILEAFRFVERFEDGSARVVAGRDELTLVRAFSETAERALAGIRDVVGDRRARPLAPAFVALAERTTSRARAYLEAAADAHEVVPAPHDAACVDAGSSLPCSTGPRFAWRGDTFAGGDVTRCANHLIPMLEVASDGLVRLGMRRNAWFSERAAGVVVSRTCRACGGVRDERAVVTDRRVIRVEAIGRSGLSELFDGKDGGTRPAARSCGCPDARACEPLDTAALGDLVARDGFDADLRLAWTCDVRAYLARGAAGCDLATAASGAVAASRLHDLRSFPRFALESR